MWTTINLVLCGSEQSNFSLKLLVFILICHVSDIVLPDFYDLGQLFHRHNPVSMSLMFFCCNRASTFYGHDSSWWFTMRFAAVKLQCTDKCCRLRWNANGLRCILYMGSNRDCRCKQGLQLWKCRPHWTMWNSTCCVKVSSEWIFNLHRHFEFSFWILKKIPKVIFNCNLYFLDWWLCKLLYAYAYALCVQNLKSDALNV